MGVEPATYVVQSEHATAEPWGSRPGGNFRSFNLHGKEKNSRKNEINTDPNLDKISSSYMLLA